MMQKLSELRRNERARIVRVAHEGPIAGRLWALGLMPGVDIRVVGVAPLGDPLLVQMNGSRLSLRREEAEKLLVEGRGGGERQAFGGVVGSAMDGSGTGANR